VGSGKRKNYYCPTISQFDKKIAWLKVDNFKEFFAEDSSIALNYVNGSAIATLEYLFKQGFSVVMDGVFKKQRQLMMLYCWQKKKILKQLFIR